MKNNNKELLLTTLLCLLPILAGLLLYNRLPETVATHFGSDGEANGWSSRAFAVFGLPAIMAGLNLLVNFGLRSDPKKQNMSPVLRSISVWIIPILSIGVSALTLIYALGYNVRVDKILFVFVGVVFLAIGNYLPKTKQSYTMGIKLPWTLASEENWNRTHRLAGFLFVGGGILILLLAMIGLYSTWVFLVLVAVLVLVPTIYSYALYKKQI